MMLFDIPIWVILLLFTIIILVPWFGGLVLIAMNFIFAYKNLLFLSDRLRAMRNDNVQLMAEKNKLQDDLSTAHLRLQGVMLENAALGLRREHDDKGFAG